MQISFWNSIDIEVFINGKEVEIQLNGEKQDSLLLSDLIDDYLDSTTDIDGKICDIYKDQVNGLLHELKKSIEMIHESS